MPHVAGHVQEPDSAVARELEKWKHDPFPAGAGVLGAEAEGARAKAAVCRPEA